MIKPATSLIFLLSTIAHAETGPQKLPDACAFEKTILFGASITANTMKFIGLPTAPLTGAVRYGTSPGQVLVNKFAGLEVYRNYSAMLGNPTGAQQIDDMMTNHEVEMRNASAFIGIDAFYWDAGWGVKWAPAAISNFIDFATRNQKLLILGTVPIENPDTIKWEKIPFVIKNFLASHDRYAWLAPQPDLADEINQIIRAKCLAKNSCYIVDLAAMSEVLNLGKKLSLRNGQSYDLYGMRPDGVHLSHAGSKYIVEQMLTSLAASPPRVDTKTCGTGTQYWTPPPFYGP